MATSRLDSHSYYIQYDAPITERTWSVCIASFSASLATVNFGYALGYTAQAELTTTFTKAFSHKEQSFSIFASVVALGALAGSLLAGWLIDRVGRKSTILFTSVLYTPGWLLIAYSPYSNSMSMLYFGRIITGMGVGMSSVAVPVYIAEVASARTRGGFGNVNQLSINFGFLTAYTVGLSNVIEITALVPVGITAMNVVLMICMPETPRWLLANNKRYRAIQVLSWLRGYEYQIEEECFEIESSLGFGDQQEKWTLSDLKEATFYRPLIIGILLMFFQEFSGINCILFYCTVIFQKAGIGSWNEHQPSPMSDSAEMSSIYLCLTLFVFTLVSCVLVDRVGRRKLLIVGSVAMTITLFLLGLYFRYFPPVPIASLAPTNLAVLPNKIRSPYTIIAVVVTLLYIAFFSIGWGPLPWLLMSEFFPLKTRGIATSVITFMNWLFVFISTVIFDPLVDVIHEDGIFWFFAILTFVGFLFTMYFVPETRGRPLEDITDLFHNNRLWRMHKPCGCSNRSCSLVNENVTS